MSLLRAYLLFFCINLLFTYHEVFAICSKPLSLSNAIYLALRNNPQVHSAELQRIVDKFALEIAHNQFWPQYDINVSATYANEVKPYYTANPSVTIQTAWGTLLNARLEDQINDGRQTAAVLEIIQPLLRGCGQQVNLVKFKNACDQEIINRLIFKGILEDTINKVIQTYYKLVQDNNNLEIDRLSIAEAVKMLNDSQLLVNAGHLAGAELIQQQGQIANLKISLAKDQYSSIQDYRELISLLGLNPLAKLVIEKKIVINIRPLPSTTEAITIALANNVDYQRSLYILKQMHRALIVAQDELKWKLNLVGRVQQEVIGNKNFTNVPINQIDTIGNNVPSNNRSLILNLNIPIDDKERKQNLIKAKIALQQYKLALDVKRQHLIADVLNKLENLKIQSCQIKLTIDALSYSRQAIEIARKKYKYGRTTSFEIISLQHNSILQQLGLVSAQISYLNTETELQKLLGMTLNKWRVQIYY